MWVECIQRDECWRNKPWALTGWIELCTEIEIQNDRRMVDADHRTNALPPMQQEDIVNMKYSRSAEKTEKHIGARR